jgi:hypothetical protein
LKQRKQGLTFLGGGTVYWDVEEIALDVVASGGLKNRDGVKDSELSENDVALILRTSTAAGRPKAVRYIGKSKAVSTRQGRQSD